MYLDYAATTPLLPQVKDYMVSLLDTYQNPSSMYQSGVEAKKIITTARNNVAKFINADSKDIIFTSGGSAITRYLLKVIQINIIAWFYTRLHLISQS